MTIAFAKVFLKPQTEIKQQSHYKNLFFFKSTDHYVCTKREKQAAIRNHAKIALQLDRMIEELLVFFS